ncbi:MAG: sugar transferase [Sphingobacteriales bacterium]|jgi:lipopolysaccharide/colanic/teichoic acid biosynthesis glycosyltransferase|nr:sugar transferase [Sphingobacteriales bacterium]
MKRAFDLLLSVLVLLPLIPLLLFIGIAVILDNPGPVFYRQVRVGKNASPFRILKFRTMYRNSDRKGLLTVGGRDPRVTRVGYWLRKYKLDELPQLFNVLEGSMSLVGPRPEVEKYVALYDDNQRRVLEVKPGITDYASIQYSDENELLAKADDPERMYIEEVMPAKLKLNLDYIRDQGMLTDLKILMQTALKILR